MSDDPPPAGSHQRLPEDLPPLREVIAAHGLDARKSLGQHFLLDLNLTRRIVRAAALPAGCTVIEVGPGPGGLTRALLEADVDRVVAVEVDPRAVAAMHALADRAQGRLQVLEADALSLDLVRDPDSFGPPPWAVVANLPYNVGTPLLLRWLDPASRLHSMTLMFQKEVAERLTASPGSKTYGRLSVMTQWLCEAARCFNVPAAAFTPPPKVASQVVRLVPRPEPLAPAAKQDMEAVTAAAFGQRRKMLRQSLKTLVAPAEPLLDAAVLDGTARAEEIDVAGFAALARAWADTRRAAGNQEP